MVGIGPGNPMERTYRATQAILSSHVVVGYKTYVQLIQDLIEGKEVIAFAMTEEVERCRIAIKEAMTGKKVSLISSGDPGIYGMAGLVLEILAKEGIILPLEVIPGIPSANMAASLLGAPLMADYATISLSDLLVPWPKIGNKLRCIAACDMVAVLYNPRSKKRTWQIDKARDIFLEYRKSETPVGIASHMGTSDEKFVITTLEKLLDEQIDMRTVIIIGNSTTFLYEGWMITPRGYRL